MSRRSAAARLEAPPVIGSLSAGHNLTSAAETSNSASRYGAYSERTMTINRLCDGLPKRRRGALFAGPRQTERGGTPNARAGTLAKRRRSS